MSCAMQMRRRSRSCFQRSNRTRRLPSFCSEKGAGTNAERAVWAMTLDPNLGRSFTRTGTANRGSRRDCSRKHFALCQTLPPREFDILAAYAAAGCGYRPIRFRPHAAAARVRVAVVLDARRRGLRQVNQGLAKEAVLPLEPKADANRAISRWTWRATMDAGQEPLTPSCGRRRALPRSLPSSTPALPSAQSLHGAGWGPKPDTKGPTGDLAGSNWQRWGKPLQFHRAAERGRRRDALWMIAMS